MVPSELFSWLRPFAMSSNAPIGVVAKAGALRDGPISPPDRSLRCVPVDFTAGALWDGRRLPSRPEPFAMFSLLSCGRGLVGMAMFVPVRLRSWLSSETRHRSRDT